MWDDETQSALQTHGVMDGGKWSGGSCVVLLWLVLVWLLLMMMWVVTMRGTFVVVLYGKK